MKSTNYLCITACCLTVILMVIAQLFGHNASAQTPGKYGYDFTIQRQITSRAELDKKILQIINSAGSKRHQLLRQYRSMREYLNQLLLDKGSISSAVPVKPEKTETAQKSTAASSGYDWYVSTAGSDSNAGTQDAPFLTIQKAVNISTANTPTMIKVEDGTYAGCINVAGNKSIKITGNINAPNAVVIDGSGNGTVVSVSDASLWFNGIKITGGRNGNEPVICLNNSSFEMCNAIIADNTSNKAIIGSASTSDYFYSGITLYNTLVYKNNVNGESENGIICGNYCYIMLINNTITDNIAPATIVLQNWSTLYGFNSILYNILSNTELIDSNTYLDLYYCNVHNYATLTGQYSQVGSGMIDTNPVFVSQQEELYQLADNSPCIDAGEPYSGSYYDAFLPPAKGTLRCDLGAYGGMNVSGQPYQMLTPAEIRYDYDASGNLIKRERILVSNMTGAVMQSLSKSAVSKIGIDAENAAAVDADFPEPATGPSEEWLQDLKITVYPNPTRGNLQIDVTGGMIPEKARIVLYNISGTVIRQINQIQSVNYVDISAYPSGVYVMRVYLGDEVSIWKIIKE